MAGAFASASDVELRWRTLSPDENMVAGTLCEDASDIIRVRWPDVDSRIASGALNADSVRRVVANMVKRAMLVGDAEGLESRAQTAGPFSVNDKFSNPNANLYLTAEDVRLFEPDGYGVHAKVGWLA